MPKKLFNKGTNDDLEIDISSELEKIKNSNTSKKEMENMNIDLSLFEDEYVEFIEDDSFLKNLNDEIELFNSSLTSKQIKEIKKIIKEHNYKQKAIVLSEHQLNKPKPINQAKEQPIEDIDALINGFNSEIEKQTPTEYRKPFFKRKIAKNPAKTEIKIDESLLKADPFDLLDTKFICVWFNHSKTRFKERVLPNYFEDEKNKINNFLIETFTNNHLNDKQEYELRYRTDDVKTFKVVAFKDGHYILVKTLYRIDKDSKEEYYQEKSKYKKHSK